MVPMRKKLPVSTVVEAPARETLHFYSLRERSERCKHEISLVIFCSILFSHKQQTADTVLLLLLLLYAIVDNTTTIIRILLLLRTAAVVSRQ